MDKLKFTGHNWVLSEEGLKFYQDTPEVVHTVPRGHYVLGDMIEIRLKGNDEIKQKLRVVAFKENNDTGRDEITLVLEWSEENERKLTERLRRLGYIT